MIEKSERPFLLERLHSLTGFLPIGVFLAAHLAGRLMTVRPFGSPETFNRHVAVFLGTPAVRAFFEVFLLALPIGFHAIYGLVLTRRSSVNVERYGYQRNWAYLLERATGAFLLLFIAVHVYRERIASGVGDWAAAAAGMSGAELAAWGGHATSPYRSLASHLASAPYYWFTVLGVLAASLHFANGLWSFAIRFGLTVSPRAQRLSQYACGLVFVALSIAGVAALRSFTAVAR